MTGPQLRDLADRIDLNQIRRIAIPAELPHATIGASPSVMVTDMQLGMDWDNGTLFVRPQTPLTSLTPADLEEIKSVRAEGQSWAMNKAYKRWSREFDALVDINQKLRCALLQKGMTTEELMALAGEPVRKKGRSIKGAK
ncbi:hypothetical protein VPZ60_004221 [Salmonella enterica]|nr:hypothetical protein [Salmonella enterica]